MSQNQNNQGGDPAATEKTTSLDVVAEALGVPVSDEMRPQEPTNAGAGDGDGKPPAKPNEEQGDQGKKPAATDSQENAKKADDGKTDASAKPEAKKTPTEAEIAAVLDGAPAGKAEPDKTGDALLDDPIPEEIKGRTRERMENLLQRGRESHIKLKEQEQKVAELVPLAEQAEGWTKVVVQTGLAPEEFAIVVGTMAAIHSGTIEQKKQALARIENLRNIVAAQIGEPVGGDPLEGHDDLRRMVEDVEITREKAIELATLRNRTKAQQQFESTEQSRRQQEGDLQRERQNAESQLNALQGVLVERDGESAFNVRKLIAFRTLRATAPHLHPTRWKQAFLDAYDAVPKAVVDNTLAVLAGEQGSNASGHRNMVMNPGGGGGGGSGGNGGAPRRDHKNTQDVVFSALGLTVDG